MFYEGHFEKSQTAWDRINEKKGLETCTAAVELKGYELRPSNERYKNIATTQRTQNVHYPVGLPHQATHKLENTALLENADTRSLQCTCMLQLMGSIEA